MDSRDEEVDANNEVHDEEMRCDVNVEKEFLRWEEGGDKEFAKCLKFQIGGWTNSVRTRPLMRMFFFSKKILGLFRICIFESWCSTARGDVSLESLDSGSRIPQNDKETSVIGSGHVMFLVLLASCVLFSLTSDVELS